VVLRTFFLPSFTMLLAPLSSLLVPLPTVAPAQFCFLTIGARLLASTLFPFTALFRPLPVAVALAVITSLAATAGLTVALQVPPLTVEWPSCDATSYSTTAAVFALEILQLTTDAPAQFGELTIRAAVIASTITTLEARF